MPQIINDPGRAAGLGAAIGQGFGSGVGSILQAVTQNKLNQMLAERNLEAQRSRIASALESAGRQPQYASLLSMMDPKEQGRFLGTIPAIQPAQQPSAIQQVRGLQPQQPITKPLEQFNQNPVQQEQSQYQQLAQLMANPMDVAVAQKIAAQPTTESPLAPQINKPVVAPQAQAPVAKKTAASQPARVVPTEVLAKIQPSPVEVAKAQTAFGLTATQRQKAINDARREQAAINKEVKPYVELLDKKGGQGAKIADWTLNRMEKLIETGNLTGSAMYNFRKKLESAGGSIGAGIGSVIGGLGGAFLGSTVPGIGTLAGAGAGAYGGGKLGSAVGEAVAPKFVGTKEDQEFTKLSMNFLQNMKDIFGSRVTQQEVSIFLDSIPTLAQTDEGKKAVIRDMKLISDGWRHKKQIKDRIVAANGGVMPANIEQLVEEASTPYMDKLAQQFAEGTPLKAAVA